LQKFENVSDALLVSPHAHPPDEGHVAAVALTHDVLVEGELGLGPDEEKGTDEVAVLAVLARQHGPENDFARLRLVVDVEDLSPEGQLHDHALGIEADFDPLDDVAGRGEREVLDRVVVAHGWALLGLPRARAKEHSRWARVGLAGRRTREDPV
jgi:hypothetical protein